MLSGFRFQTRYGSSETYCWARLRKREREGHGHGAHMFVVA